MALDNVPGGGCYVRRRTARTASDIRWVAMDNGGISWALDIPLVAG